MVTNLPNDIPSAQVLITVKTYPLPSSKYEELVCTAGILSTGEWIRIYPIPFRSLSYATQYKKYDWVELNLVRNTSDFRPESYSPKQRLDEPIRPIRHVDTGKDWQERKDYVLREVFNSMGELIALAKGDERKSLATVKPAEIIDLVIEDDEREWKQEWRDQLLQYKLFERDEQGQGKQRDVVRKLPYKYSYKLRTKGDNRPRTMMIEDWEIGALYWNCLAQTEGDEVAANRLVRQKYYDDFLAKRDIYLFVGTTKQFHLVSPNPFVIIGVFYPPKLENAQLKLF